MKILSWIKKQDMFGYKIGLTMNGNDTYNTAIGGFFSILINIMIYTYMILNLITMFTPGAGDFLGTVIENIIVDDIGEINMENLHLRQFVAIRKQGDKGKQLFLDDEFHKYDFMSTSTLHFLL